MKFWTGKKQTFQFFGRLNLRSQVYRPDHGRNIIENERPQYNVAAAGSSTRTLPVPVTTPVKRRRKAIFPRLILFYYLIRRTTGTTDEKTGERVNVLLFVRNARRTPYGRVMVHDCAAAVPLFHGYQWREHAFNIHHFFFWLLTAAGTFPVIVTVVAAVHRVSDKVGDGFRSPFAAALRRYVVRVAIVPYFAGGTRFFIKIIHKPGEHGFRFAMLRELCFFVPFPPKRDAGAVPLAGESAPDHNVFHAFTCQFPFQFGKYKNNFQNCFTNRGTGVKLFIQRNKGNAVILKIIIH